MNKIVFILFTLMSGALLNTLNYSWETSNSNSYLCSKKGIDVKSGAGVNSKIACTSLEWEGTADKQSISCSAGGTIQCIIYASYGKTGGSCSGDPFKDDPSGEFEYLQDSIGTQLIEKQTFEFSLAKDNQINGVDITNAKVKPLGKKKFKVLALCTNDAVPFAGKGPASGPPSGSASGPSSNSSNYLIVTFLCVLILSLLI